MIKILSFKTRRPDLPVAAFRSHYEERHVPLGLSFLEHFRWRRYVRNYVTEVVAGSVPFDCVTEFWVGSREDQRATADFVGSPDFAVLDEDDRRFLDVSQRLSFEVSESDDAPPPAGLDSRWAIFLPREAADPLSVFEAGVRREVASLREANPLCAVSLDLRREPAPERGIGAVVWVRGEAGPTARVPSWPRATPGVAVARVEAVETPPHALHS